MARDCRNLCNVYSSLSTPLYVGTEEKEFVIAKGSDRILAWLIDFMVVGATSEAIFAIFALPFAFRFPKLDLNDFMNTAWGSSKSDP